MRCLALILPLVLVGCPWNTKPEVPKVVTVTVEKIVHVPDELTTPCDEIAKREDSYGEAVRLANARKLSLQECSARMARIRALGRQP